MKTLFRWNIRSSRRILTHQIANSITYSRSAVRSTDPLCTSTLHTALKSRFCAEVKKFMTWRHCCVEWRAHSLTHLLTHSLTHTPTSARMWVGRRENVKTWIKECVWICEYVSMWDDESVIPSQCKWKYMGVMIDSSLSVIDSATPGPYWWQSVHFPSTALRGNGIAAFNNIEREWHCLLFTLRNRHTHSLYIGTDYATSRWIS